MSAANANELEVIAAELRAAYAAFEPIAPLRERLGGGGVDAAYAVQQHNTEIWMRSGRRIVGRKIGLTSESVQRQLGVDQPDFGALFDDMCLRDGDVVPYRFVLQPRVEAEVALVLKGPLDHPALILDDVVAAIDYLLPAIEVVGSRIAEWKISLLDTIADNASSGMFVLGTTPVAPESISLAEAAMSMTIDGTVVSTGIGAACLGHPYNAALWLARRMVTEGTPLQPGDIVMTGALGPMVDLAPGAQVEATIEGLGTVGTSREGVVS